MRRAFRLSLLTIAAAVVGCGRGEPAPTASPVAAEVLFPPLSPEAVAERMKRLVAPEPGPDHNETDNAFPGADGFGGPLERARDDWNALLDLAQAAPASVEPELVRIARTHESFVARWRAIEVLAEREHPEAPALAVRLCESPIPGERSAAWWLVDGMRRTGRPPPIPAATAFARLEAESIEGVRDAIRGYLHHANDASAAPALVARLATEQDGRARAEIIAYLGAVHDTTAVPLLVARLDAETDDKARATIVEYLGNSGDARVVPALVALLARAPAELDSRVVIALGQIGGARAASAVLAAEKRVGADVWYWALGRLGTAEAVGALAGHLDDARAVDALVASRRPEAIAALERHLASLADGRAHAADLARRDRIVLARLRHDDPIPELLAIVEDRSADLELRRDALQAARDDDRLLARHGGRLVALYANETDPNLLEQCLSILDESRALGVTAAMLHHADVWSPYLMSGPEYLLRVLNRRLGTNYRTLEEVRARPAK